MKPVDFIVLFFSFVDALAVTHLLLSAALMIRRRREITFSWPHALWMADALLVVAVNWLALRDIRALPSIPLVTIVGGFVLVIGQYFICVLVSPDLEPDRDLDLRAFHARHGRTYIAAFLVLVTFGFLTNIGADLAFGVATWWRRNVLIIAMLAAILPPLISKRPWAQIGAPLVLLLLLIAVPIAGQVSPAGG